MAEKQRKSRLAKLRKSWRKATPEERMQFLQWLGEAPLAAAPLATGRYLTEESTRRIRERMTARGIDLAGLNRDLGLAPTDPAIARAMLEGKALRLAVIAALEEWLLAP
ncbi:hypothetical protein [Gellertiella hungarica]|uniref:Uncharacterized protein n=1 Tax=Gellertiella hungarica TaxID=1572859 RepID=A0A7W6J6P8_9HYPH|nr:hypothetical protein [Gellertiella hungarica]MBB4065789.1 hypothetical protein [Gellertiella hungarica]